MTMVDPTTTGTQDDASVIGSGDQSPPVSTDPSTAGGSGGGETPEQLRARVEELERIHKQDLARLSSGEEAARRTRELEDELERERAYRRTAVPPPTGYDPNAVQLAQDYQTMLQTNPEMVRLLEATALKQQRDLQEQEAKLERSRAEQRFQRELDSVPAADQAEVKRRSLSMNIWPSMAHKDLKAERFDKTESELAEQRRKLQEEQARMNRAVVRTTAAPAPASAPTGDSVTAAEWARIGRAAAAGDVTARKQVRDYDEGRLKVRD